MMRGRTTVDSAEREVIRAARAWAEAKRAWEETARMTERPENLSQIKGAVRRAERELLSKIDALKTVQGGGSEA
jgi:hypothetical protein